VNSAASNVVDDALRAAEWIAKAMTGSGYGLDFSVESLKEVDRFFDEQAPNGAPRPDGLLAKDLGSRLFAIAAYVGDSWAASGKATTATRRPKSTFRFASTQVPYSGRCSAS
jgi:hypothetical protein